MKICISSESTIDLPVELLEKYNNFMKQVSDFSKTLNLKLKLLTFNSIKEMILYLI